jgi:hypothetical protein
MTAPAPQVVPFRNDDRLLQRAHVGDQLARHAREGVDLGVGRLEELPDDVEHVAAGAERAPRPGDHDRADGRHRAQREERVRELAVRVEGKRVQTLGPVEAQSGDAALLGVAEVLALHRV